jgi:LmbE family N-acetylglucosaminyl deacetylase
MNGIHEKMPHPPSIFSFKRSGYNIFTLPNYEVYTDDLKIERDLPGKPHKGRVFAAIQPHIDDVPLYCAGLVAKLIKEGYTGYLIRISNDDLGSGGSYGEGVLRNEIDNDKIAEVLGLKKAFNLNYTNHRMDGDPMLELKTRLLFLFKVLNVDTVISFDPQDMLERNPDHTMTAEAVYRVCWVGTRKDFPELNKAGITGKSITDQYYYGMSPMGFHPVNCVVDISSVIDKKVESNIANANKGPCGHSGSRLRARLAKENKKLPILGNDDKTADFQYIKELLMHDWKVFGEQFGLEYAEPYFWVGTGQEYTPTVQDYIDEHAVPLRS